MGAVNRVPRGFLGLLDAKTQGQTPADTTGFVSPVIDLTPNYLADIPIQFAQASAFLTATGQTGANVTVPNGQLWYVYSASAEFIATIAGVRVEGIVVVNAASGALGVPLVSTLNYPDSISTASAIGDSIVRTWASAEPLLVGPGTVFASRYTFRVGGANVNALTSVIYRSVQV